MTNKRPFALLEILVGLALIAMAAALFAWRGKNALDHQQFRSDVALFEQRCALCQTLAVTMQSDWEGVLERREGEWVFTTHCLDTVLQRPLKPIVLHGIDISCNREILKNRWVVQFFSTGKISPESVLLFAHDRDRQEIAVHQINRHH